MERPECECMACRIEWLWANDELRDSEKIELRDFAQTVRGHENREVSEEDLRPSQKESKAFRRFMDL